MPSIDPHPRWGRTPWQIDFSPRAAEIPGTADIAVIGGGFTGLAAAAWLRRIAPEKSVVLLEAGRIGAGASGRTGGMALAETAAGDQPGLGDVLAGFTSILQCLGVDCDFSLPGAWEIAREIPMEAASVDSPIAWNDSGTLRVVREIPGGTLDPGKLVSGLGRAAQTLGAAIFENHAVDRVEWNETPALVLREGSSQRERKIKAGKILFANNALSLALSEFAAGMHPRLTLAIATAPLVAEQIASIGLAAGKPFYTVDFPYLWGRVRADNSVIWGAGLLSSPDTEGLERADIRTDEARRMFAAFEKRVR
ncbi:MAG: NAD(P)/FAD-dependent oxidoreductase, partial [Candidatus Acidiferrales bacterium]